MKVVDGYGDNFINVIYQQKVKCKSGCYYNIDDVKALRPLPATHQQITIHRSDYHTLTTPVNILQKKCLEFLNAESVKIVKYERF